MSKTSDFDESLLTMSQVALYLSVSERVCAQHFGSKPSMASLMSTQSWNLAMGTFVKATLMYGRYWVQMRAVKRNSWAFWIHDYQEFIISKLIINKLFSNKPFISMFIISLLFFYITYSTLATGEYAIISTIFHLFHVIIIKC